MALALYDIEFRSKVAIKSQALTDFLLIGESPFVEVKEVEKDNELENCDVEEQ